MFCHISQQYQVQLLRLGRSIGQNFIGVYLNNMEDYKKENYIHLDGFSKKVTYFD